MLSIVIPTKNEEYYLPRLLYSLARQSFQDFEVIVADAESTDRTRDVARAFGAKVVGGGLPGVGRNRGAKVAKGKDLLFLDADVVLPRRFLELNYGKFVRKKYDVATTLIRPLSGRLDDALIHVAWNGAYLALERVKPACCGFHIFVRKSVFNRVGGFDESVVWGEDSELIERLDKKGAKYRVLKAVPVLVSVRRLKKEGRVKFVVKNVHGFLHQTLKGPLRKELFEYEWCYSPEDARKEVLARKG